MKISRRKMNTLGRSFRCSRHVFPALVIWWWCMASATVFLLAKDSPVCPALCACPIRKHEGLTANCSGVGNNRTMMTKMLPQLATNLSNLFFTRNKLDLAFFNQTLPAKIKRGLKLIDLSLNDLQSLLPRIFDEYSHLESLFLSRNCLKSIEQHSFKGLQNLRLLNLDNNQIKRFHSGAFEGLNQLQDLSATGNDLLELRADVLNPIPSLQHLLLDNNSLTTLDEDFLPRFVYFTFRNVHFRGNPFHCDCRLTWLAVWYRNQAVEIDQKSPVPICTWPDSNKGKSLIEVPLINFKCGASKSLFSECREWNTTNASSTTLNETRNATDNLRLNDSCFGCSRGFYGPHVSQLNDLNCQLCSEFETSQPGSTLKSQCHCRTGFYRETKSNSCTPCPMGLYKARAGDLEPCLSCARGSSTHTNGASICDCDAGYYMKHGSCLECAPNTYKTYRGPRSVGPYGCFPCPDGRISPRASTSIQQCVCLTGSVNDSRNSCSVDLSRQPQHPSSVKQLMSHGDASINVATSHVIAVYVGGSLTIVIVALAILRQFIWKKRKRYRKKLELRAVSSFLPRVAVDTGGYALDTLPTDGWEIDIGQIALTRILGEGAFGVVYEAVAADLPNTSEPTTVAVKTLRDECTAEERNALRSELEQLLYVGQHPNIVNLLGCVTVKGCFMLVMEYAQNGDLLSYLKSKKVILANHDLKSPASDDEAISEESAALHQKAAMTSEDRDARNANVREEQLLSFAWQIAKGMDHLSGIKCIHRDLAARNVLLTDGWIVKITDFGLARAVYESGYYFKQSKGRLPFKWMAPEAILQGQYTVKSDVWSFGVLLWEMVTLGSTPYPGVPIHSLLDLLLSGYRMPKPQDCLLPLYEIMASCWQEHPVERPTFEKLLEKLEILLVRISDNDYMDIPADSEADRHLRHRGTSYENDVSSAWPTTLTDPVIQAYDEQPSRMRSPSLSND